MTEYIVTARKWRPMKFEDVIGQLHITTTLRNAIASGRLAHAYLFSGPRGVGKTTTARLLAKAVNCEHPLDQNPDNTCERCREITEGRSFDVLEIDGASNRGVDEIRNLRESVRYAPSKGPYKVYIIDEVHMLTKEAFNALLKTLEEPPPHVLFIFATTEINRVPPTILSRCQKFDFRRIKTEEIAANLRTIARAEGLEADEESLMMIARKGDGSLRDAQSLFDQVIALCGTTITAAGMIQAMNMVDQEMYFRVTDLIKTGDAKGGLDLVEEVMTKGHDLREFLSGLAEHLRNLLIVKATGATTLLETSDVYRRRYAVEAASFPMVDLLRLQRFVNGTESALRWSAQPRFKVEADMVQMITMPRAREVGDLVQELDELKKKTGEGSHFADAPVSPAHVASAPSPGVLRDPAPAVSAVLSEAEISSRWGDFLAEVRETKISLLSVMEGAQLLGVNGDVVRLGVEDDFQVERVEKNKKALGEMFHKVFHRNVRLAAEVSAEAKRKQKEAADTPEHPIITALKRELGAEPL